MQNEELKEKISKGINVVKFGAEWCGPCKAIQPILESFENDERIENVIYIDADDNEELLMQYRVRGIPTTIIFKDGVIKETLVGQKTRAEFNAAVDNC